MKKKMADSNMPLSKLTRIKDFLPSPSALVLPDQTVKVTIFLKRSSIDFFKRQAQQYHTKYQRMIREVIDRYTSHYAQA